MARETDISKNVKIKNSYLATKAKRESQSCRVLTVKIQTNKLNTVQKNALKMMFVEAKWMYNHILNLSQTQNIFDLKYTDLNTVAHFDKTKTLIESQLTSLSSQMKQGVLDGLHANIHSLSKHKNKGSNVGKLKFISEYKSINLKQYGNSYKIASKNKVKIQGIKKPLKVNGLKQILSLTDYDLANAKLINSHDGYFIAITVYTKTNIFKPTDKIGVDFGCQTSLTLSNGKKINCVVAESEHIKNVKRKMAKCKNGSNNKRKLSFRLRKLNQMDLNRKNDMSNKLCHELLQNYVVVMQDEQLHLWATEHGKKIQYGVLGRVKNKLTSNPNTIVLNKWLPTSKFCNRCGSLLDLTLHDRVFNCDCGECMDRDTHAAVNMLWFDKNIIGVGRTDYTPDTFRETVKRFFDVQEAAKSLA